MVEELVLSTDLVAAFQRMRGHWKRLYEGPPDSSGERSKILEDLDEDLGTICAAGRASADARSYIEAAFRIRLDEWCVSGRECPPDVAEAADGVRSGFEMRLRTLRQMESGDEILPDSGRDTRRTAARDVNFFRKLRQLLLGETEVKEDEAKKDSGDAQLTRLSQSYDARRKLVREDMVVPPPAVEAVEFLLRLGASN